MKTPVLFSLAVLAFASIGSAAQVCVDASPNVKAAALIANPNGSMSIVTPVYVINGIAHAIADASDDSSADAVCKLFRKTKSVSHQFAYAKTATAYVSLSADGTVTEVSQFAPEDAGSLLSLVVCQ